MIPEGWKNYRLGDISEVIDCPHSTPTWINKGIFVIRSWNVRKGRLIFDKKSFTDEETYYDRIKRGQPSDGDIVLTREAPMGEVCMIPKGLKCCLGQRVVLLKVKENFDKAFLLYSLQSPKIQDKIKTNEGTGSVVSNFRIPDIKALELLMPEDFNKQRSIASILSSLDNKIELNLRMNKTLEAIAQAIFKEWFVDFRFPGFDGEMVDGLPKGWRKVPIRSLFKTHIGGDWGKEEQSNEFPVRVAVIRGTDFDRVNRGDVSKVPIRFIKEVNAEKKRLVNGDILLEISGGSTEQPTGRTILLTNQILKLFDCPVVPASFCRLIRPLDFSHSLFLSIFLSRFYSLGGTWEYQNQSTGISNFQFTYFSEDKKLTIPDNSVMISEFGKIVVPIIEKQNYNIIQINNLTEIRDALLPKLMTGKI